MNLFNQKTKAGFIVVQSIVFASIAIVLMGGLISWAAANIMLSRKTFHNEQALQIAEAGIEYYRWHLAHDAFDFQDGTGEPGPYLHEYTDKDGNRLGEFELDITPPAVGTTLVTIRSTGRVDADPNIEKVIELKVFYTSFAKFAFVSNSEMRFGEGTEVFGPIHSNGGIRFDGLAHNSITSAVAEYDDPDHSGDNEFGVHTHVSPTDPEPPSAVPSRPDVFEAEREFPVPAVDFVGIASQINHLRDYAIEGGAYYANSGALGYRIKLKTNDTFDIYKVNSLYPAPNRCTNVQNESGWGTWSINTTAGATTTVATNVPFPANGIIFAEDNIWVDGQIDGARLTIGSGRFPDTPSTQTSITINNDLLYTNYDGTDIIALVAQKNINVGLLSENDLRIDAALVAQSGRIGRYYYVPNANWPSSGGQSKCSPNHVKSLITLYGMLASYGRYGFAWTDNTGYTTRTIIYDANLLYAPPPDFPITSDRLITLSWELVEQ